MLRPDVYASVSGGGPAITYLAGAAAAVDARARVLGWSGASAGSIVAVCKAFGVPDEVTREMLVEVLASGQALTAGVANLPRGGLFSLDVIGDLLDRHIGADAKMGQATTGLVVAVTDLDRASVRYLTKARDPDVVVREAVIASCSFMCGVVPAAEIPSMSLGDYTPGIKLWGDGGLTDNTVDGVRDAKKDPRVSICHDAPDDGTRLRPGDVPGILAAIPRALLWAPSQRKSHRRDGLDVDVQAANDWAFKKSPARVALEWAQGYDSVGKHAPWFLGVANPTGSLIG
jgi:predicted acylesterase/phospholipase RssA